ncbi:MAG: amino acid ABC transporter permease [Gammaproteobacteria bacterium]|nr:amino acid ABC transporter permease [Gammaproteobacteria bacterium]
MTAGRRNKKTRWSWIDLLVIAAVIAFVVFVVVRVETVLRYTWNWGHVMPFLAYVDEDTGRWVTNLLLEGLILTMRLAVIGIVISALIGVVMGLCRISNNLFLRMVARTYVELVRNTPPLVFIFIFYFFLSSQLMPLLGVDDLARSDSEFVQWMVRMVAGDPSLFSNFVAGLISLSLFEGAYITEIVRAGIQSIPRGQWEAGKSMGLSGFDVMRNVILPQAVSRIMPPLANQFIILIKDSSIVSLISIQELTFMAVEVGVSTSRVFEVWILTAVMYFVICYACVIVFNWLERRAERSKR